MFKLLAILMITSGALAESYVQQEPQVDYVRPTNLDSKSAGVYMTVAPYAKVTGLEDIYLRPTGIDGEAGTEYKGFDKFNLESNTAVLVVTEGTPLSNGERQLKASYILDEKSDRFETSKGTHNSEHKIDVGTQLGNISSQEAGNYSGKVTITVSAL